MFVIVSKMVYVMLPSGHDSTVLEGLDTIIKLVKQANDRITIMPGGGGFQFLREYNFGVFIVQWVSWHFLGIRETNVKRILSTVELKEMHVSASTVVPSIMEHRISTIHMGRAYYNSEYTVNGVNEERLKKIISATDRK